MAEPQQTAARHADERVLERAELLAVNDEQQDIDDAAEHQQQMDECRQWSEMMVDAKRIRAEIRECQAKIAAGDERIRLLLIDSLKASAQ